MDKAWLKELKVGDKVAVRDPNGWHVGVVQKVNKTTVSILLDRYKTVQLYYIIDGYERRSGSSRGHIEPLTPDILNIMRKGVLTSKLNHVDWRSLPLEILEKVYGIVHEHLPVSEVRRTR